MKAYIDTEEYEKLKPIFIFNGCIFRAPYRIELEAVKEEDGPLCRWIIVRARMITRQLAHEMTGASLKFDQDRRPSGRRVFCLKETAR